MAAAPKKPYSEYTISDLLPIHNTLTKTHEITHPGDYQKPIKELLKFIEMIILKFDGLSDYNNYILDPATCITHQLSLLPLSQLEAVTICLGHLLQLRSIPADFHHSPLSKSRINLVSFVLETRKLRLATESRTTAPALKRKDYIALCDLLSFITKFMFLAARAPESGYYSFCISYPDFGKQLAMWGRVLQGIFRSEKARYGLRFEEFYDEDWYWFNPFEFLLAAGRSFRISGVPQCEYGAERELVLGRTAMRRVDEIVEWGVYRLNECEAEQIVDSGLRIRLVDWSIGGGDGYDGDLSSEDEGLETIEEREEDLAFD